MSKTAAQTMQAMTSQMAQKRTAQTELAGASQ